MLLLLFAVEFWLLGFWLVFASPCPPWRFLCCFFVFFPRPVPWSNIFLPSGFLHGYMSALYIFALRHSELKLGAKIFIPVSMTLPARKGIVLDTKQKALIRELSASFCLLYDCQVHPLLCVSLTHWSACPQKGITYVVECKLAYTQRVDLLARGFPVSFSCLIKTYK